MTTLSLIPCPFCGTNRTRVHEWTDGAIIICECGAKGPDGHGEAKIQMACDLWNRRKSNSILPHDLRQIKLTQTKAAWASKQQQINQRYEAIIVLTNTNIEDETAILKAEKIMNTK